MADKSPSVRPRKPTAFMASAYRVKLREKPMMRKTDEWQKEAWQGYELVGEIQHAIDYIANLISKVRLFGAYVSTDPRVAPKPDTNDLADGAILALRTKGGSYSSILREVAINLFVAGECYLVGRDAETTQGVEFWEVLSSDELTITNDRFLIRDFPSGPVKEYTDSEIVVIRIITPHPRWGGLPISPLRGVLSSAEEIQRIERVIRGAAKSRSAGPGLLLMPEEASFGNADPSTGSGSDGAAEQDPFTTALIKAMVTPIEDEGSAASVVPIVVRGPGEVLDKIRKVSLAIDVDTELIKLERALTRLAQGLPLPPEVVTGKEGLSHWTSWQIAEDMITAYVEPFIVPILDALTIEYYRDYLETAGMPEDEARERMLWYDVTALITRPNRSADADFGLEHIALSDEAWRRIKGFTSEDAPNPLEKLVRLLLQRGSLDPISTVSLLQALGIAPDNITVSPQLQPPAPQPPSADSPEDRSPPDMTRPRTTGPPRAKGPAPLIYLPSPSHNSDEIGSQLYNLDHELRVRIHTAADAAVSRALERASSTIVSKLRHRNRFTTLVRDVPKAEVASRIGRPSLEAEGLPVAGLIAGAFDPLVTRFRDWVVRTYNRSGRILGIPIAVPDELLDQSSENLSAELIAWASDRLFNDSPDEPFGELEGTLSIPQGIIRQALYRAGGGTELLPSNLSPAGGIATGSLILRTLCDAGGSIDGWEWVYASTVRSREFEPHAQLHGVRFDSFSDPVLANKGTWPAVAFYHPGDHHHCSCGLKPLIQLPPAQEATA